MAARGKIIIAHLGSGARLSALHNSKPIDTTMSMTPASGIPMSTRSGDLDPGLAVYLARTHNYSTDQFTHMAHFESGLLGISETTADMKKLLEIEVEDGRANHNLHVRGYKEEGTITTAFDMTVRNDMDRFHLVLDVIERVGITGANALQLKQLMKKKLIEHTEYIQINGVDMPEISGWQWATKSSS